MATAMTRWPTATPPTAIRDESMPGRLTARASSYAGPPAHGSLSTALVLASTGQWGTVGRWCTEGILASAAPLGCIGLGSTDPDRSGLRRRTEGAPLGVVGP